MTDKTKNFLYLLYGVIGAVMLAGAFVFYLAEIWRGDATFPEALSNGIVQFFLLVLVAAGGGLALRFQEKRAEDRKQEIVDHMDNGFKHEVANAVAEKVKTDVIPNATTENR